MCPLKIPTRILVDSHLKSRHSDQAGKTQSNTGSASKGKTGGRDVELKKGNSHGSQTLKTLKSLPKSINQDATTIRKKIDEAFKEIKTAEKKLKILSDNVLKPAKQDLLAKKEEKQRKIKDNLNELGKCLQNIKNDIGDTLSRNLKLRSKY